MNFNDKGIRGNDVSFYQDDPNTTRQVDFAKMKANGADFVIIRAGQRNWIDSDFVYNWQKAKEAGLPRGAYWFYDPREAPVKQAKMFAELFRNDPPEGRLWADFEYPDSWGGAYNHWTYWKVFLEELKRLTNLPVGIYTADWWWATKAIGDYAYFGKYPLWVAQYTGNPADVKLPKGWTSCLLWQYTDNADGLAAGCESKNVDDNKFNGDAADFLKEFGNYPTPNPPPAAGTAVIDRVDVTVNGVRYFAVNVPLNRV